MKLNMQSIKRLSLAFLLMSGNALANSAPNTAVPDSLTLFDFEQGFDLGSAQTSDAKVSLVHKDGSQRLLVETGMRSGAPGVTIKRANGSWDLNDYYHVKMDITNAGDQTARIIFKVGDPADGMEAWQMEIRFDLAPGQTKTVSDDIITSPWRFTKPLQLLAMRAAPGQAKTDLSAINQVKVTINSPDANHKLLIDNIRATNPVRWVEPAGFLPFVDRFGQYKHAHWPGKTLSVDDLRQQAIEEDRELAANPSPANFNQYGGWKDGPQLKATGYFRVEKYNDVWWFVDPDGRLFWSHGVGVVNAATATTGTTDRENYFEWLPEKDTAYGAFYSSEERASHGYYSTLDKRETYNFTASNLYQKYGQNWKQDFDRVTHARLHSWGMNSLGVASDKELTMQGKTPYTETVWVTGTKKIAASNGYWGKFHDVFDPSFRSQLKKSLSKRQHTVDDPWLLGFFIENELSWGAEGSLAIATLASPAEQPAKVEFLKDLKAKYKTINKLNQVWGTQHSSWNALLASTETPDQVKAWDDLQLFYQKIVQTYFSTVKNELKKVAPKALYLGCRLAWANSDTVIHTAAEYTDVISMNKYQYNVTDVGLPEGVDRPILIGEFHFGSLDRGALHLGVVEASSQSERAELYTEYVNSALLNPYIIGTHWFQYAEQPPTGRGDGENYNVGIVDLADKPFPELVKSIREVGDRMYIFRHSAATNGDIVQPKKPAKLDFIQVDEDAHTRSN
ncbi:beta-galactosidase [Paraglaciecola hydrolytica]|uniref:Beta-agarase n=1 Tax=Paraglaciecola hydrolytica TaxID=1799789 RepID=A0A136A0R9_9ALTE|nr:beta-galactosidase [Paraglaciecola hydrolytica]KXI28848.1 beta-agarase [Paraglaciecola hydrolytica]QEP52093.1 exo-beta-agarase [Paraglaciecola hydrolytica]